MIRIVVLRSLNLSTTTALQPIFFHLSERMALTSRVRTFNKYTKFMNLTANFGVCCWWL